jgi:hypothetical protein
MPIKPGFIQAAVGALCTAAFFISHQFGAPEGKLKRVSGRLEKTGERTFCLVERNARNHEFELGGDAMVYLNERQIDFQMLPSGKTVSVQFEKKKRRLIAKVIDVFPTHEDFTNQSS